MIREKRRFRSSHFSQRIACERLEDRRLLTAAVRAIDLDSPAITLLPELQGQQLLATSDGLQTAFYSTDGTQAGTIALFTIDAALKSEHDEFVVANDRVFFVAADEISGTELWSTDGTQAGTVLLETFPDYSRGSNFFQLDIHEVRNYETFDLQIDEIDNDGNVIQSNVVEEFHLTANRYESRLPQGVYQYRVRGVDGDQASDWFTRRHGTVRPASGDPFAITTNGNEVFFASQTKRNESDTFGTTALWRSDGTVGGTSPFLLNGEPWFMQGVKSLTLFDEQIIVERQHHSHDQSVLLIDPATGESRPLAAEYTRVIGNVGHQFIVYARASDHHQLAKLASADAEPEIFFSIEHTQVIPTNEETGLQGIRVPRTLDEIVVDDTGLSFTIREHESHINPDLNCGRDCDWAIRHIVQLASTRWESDLTTGGTVAGASLNDGSTTRFSGRSHWELLNGGEFLPTTVHVNGQAWYVGADNELTTSLGQPIVRVPDNADLLATIDGADVILLGHPEDDSELLDLLRINADTRQVTPLESPVRNPSALVTRLDEVFIRSGQPDGRSLLLKLDDDATAVGGPVITSPTSNAVLPRNTVTVQWSSVLNAESYDVIIYRNGRALQESLGQTETEFMFPGTAGENGAVDYEVRVFANLSDGTISRTSRVSFSVAPHSGPQIIGLEESDTIPEGVVNLWWTRSIVQSYEVTLERLWPDGTVGTVSSWNELTTTFRRPELPAGNYRLTVTGVFEGNRNNGYADERTETNVRDFTVSAGPTGPEILTPSATDERQPGEVEITWEAVDGAIAYHVIVQSRFSGLTATMFEDSQLSGTRQTVTVGPGDYTIFIRARFADGRISERAVRTFSVSATEYPVLLQTNVGPYWGNQGADIRFSAIEDAVAYQVWISDLGSSEFRYGTFNRPNQNPSGRTIRAWSGPQNMEAGEYTVFLRARTSGGRWAADGDTYTPWSPGYPLTVFHSPVSIHGIRHASTTRPTVRWSEMDPNATYDLAIYRRSNGEQVYQNRELRGIAHTLTTPLEAGEYYDVWVQATLPDGTRSRWGEFPSWMLIIDDLEAPELSFENDVLTFRQLHPESRTELTFYREGSGGVYRSSSYASVDRVLLTFPPGNYRVEGRSTVKDVTSATSQLEFTIAGEDLPASLRYEAGLLQWDFFWDFRAVRMVIHSVDEADNIVHYRVIDRFVDDSQSAQAASLDPDLPPGRYMATLYDGQGQQSAPVIFNYGTIETASPIVDSNFAEVSNRRPEFHWRDETSAPRYAVTVKNSAGQIVLQDDMVTGTTFVPEQDLPFGDLTFEVQGLHANGQRTQTSQPMAFSVVLPAVEILSNNEGGLDTTPELEWAPAAPNATYSLIVRSVATDEVVVNLTGYTETSWEFPMPLAEGIYTYQVTAQLPDGISSGAHERRELRIGVPHPSFSVVDDVATWLIVDGATTYELWINRIDEAGDTLAGRVLHDVHMVGTSRALTELSDGRYKGWIRAVRTEDGQIARSWWSRPHTFRIGSTEFDPNDRPEIRVSEQSAAWNPVQGATRYELWINQLDDQNQTTQVRILHAVDLSDTSASLFDLPSGRYAGWLRAIGLNSNNTIARSRWSSRLIFEL